MEMKKLQTQTTSINPLGNVKQRKNMILRSGDIFAQCEKEKYTKILLIISIGNRLIEKCKQHFFQISFTISRCLRLRNS